MFENLTAGNVKAAMADAGAKSSDLWMAPRDRIRVLPGFNVRVRNAEYEAHIVALGESMLANGYQKDKPLAGYVIREDGKDAIIVTDGHSRLEAVDWANAHGADIQILPVVTKPNGTSIEDLTVALVTSNSGRPLSPLELGDVCKRLMGYNMPEATIAKRLGLTPSYVRQLLQVTAAPKAVREMVAAGQISASNAAQQVRQHGEKAAEVLTGKLEEAQAAGKKKVTAKTLKTVPVEPDQADRDALLTKGLEYINETFTRGMPACSGAIMLLACLTDVDLDDITAMLDKLARG